MQFTFYGDLLGIGSAYKLGAKTAYDKLNAFYNETFRTLAAFSDLPNNHIEMFSDSLLVIGDDASHAVIDIALLFANLLRSGLLLRGAMVNGRLTYDARVTRPNFEKRLPEDNTLAKAAGLEKSQKVASFLIEPALARGLLLAKPEWSTHEGYVQTIGLEGDDQLRRICPTPDSNSFEYLYYWTDEASFEDYGRRIKDLKDVMVMYDKSIREHFEETISVIDRTKHRHKMTTERLQQ